MRLSKTQLVSGVDPQVARAIARECNFRDMDSRGVAHRLKITELAARDLLSALASGGYLTEKSRTTSSGEVLTQYAITISGGALAQASFNKPISRQKADELLAGVVRRAAEFNELPGKPMFVERVIVFGSYLNVEAQDFGDLDLHVEFAYRTPGAAEPLWLLDYADAADRTFGTMVEALGWGEREATLYLRNRSARISITTEDLARLTDKTRTVYRRR